MELHDHEPDFVEGRFAHVHGVDQVFGLFELLLDEGFVFSEGDVFHQDVGVEVVVEGDFQVAVALQDVDVRDHLLGLLDELDGRRVFELFEDRVGVLEVGGFSEFAQVVHVVDHLAEQLVDLVFHLVLAELEVEALLDVRRGDSRRFDHGESRPDLFDRGRIGIVALGDRFDIPFEKAVFTEVGDDLHGDLFGERCGEELIGDLFVKFVVEGAFVNRHRLDGVGVGVLLLKALEVVEIIVAVPKVVELAFGFLLDELHLLVGLDLDVGVDAGVLFEFELQLVQRALQQGKPVAECGGKGLLGCNGLTQFHCLFSFLSKAAKRLFGRVHPVKGYKPSRPCRSIKQ